MKLNFNHLLFAPILFISQLLINPLALAEIPMPEREALIALYNATSGPQWHNYSGWQELTSNECDWFGVSCNVSRSSVTGLQLNANNLKGLLPESIINLSFLNHISFDYNGVYSDSQTVNEFIDGLSELNYQHNQTVDAIGLRFEPIDANTVQLNWDTVSYLANEGGYRVYMAEQIDSETGSVTSDFIKQGNDIIGKTSTTFTLSELSPCRQYFVKIITYTDTHQANINAIESDGHYVPVMGTIPGLDENCLITGSPYNDSFSINQTILDNSTSAIIQVSANGERDYKLSGTNVFHIDGGDGQDFLSVLGDQSNTWTLSSSNGGDVNNNSFTSIENLIGGSGSDSFNLLAGVELDSSISASHITIWGDGDVILNADISADAIDVTGDWVILNSNLSVVGDVNINALSQINVNTIDANTCSNYSSDVTLSTGDFTTSTGGCSINLSADVGSISFDGTNILEGSIEPALEPFPQETIDWLLTMDGFEIPTEDGNTCFITDGQCIAADGSVYVFSDGVLVKQETGNGSLDIISLFLLMMYAGVLSLRNFRRQKKC